ncbi:MAG: furin-like repeat-containing protein, partial [Flammeovirgaceae bacterium]
VEVEVLQNRKNNQVDVEVPPIQETVVNEVSTLVELPVDYHTSISYYYPYFYKAHLITFNDEVDLTTLITTCADPKCNYCSPTASDKCFKCDTGYYLNGNTCQSYCPEGFVADILRSKC